MPARFEVVRLGRSFGGDDAPDFAVVDRDQTEDGIDGTVVAVATYIGALDIARLANADPDGWVKPLIEGGAF